MGEVAGPDVAAVGHLRELVAAGVLAHKPAKPRIGADTDSPEERATKWRRFQAGGPKAGESPSAARDRTV